MFQNRFPFGYKIMIECLKKLERMKRMSQEQDKFEQRKKEALKRKKELQKMQNSKVKPKTKRTLGIIGGTLLALVIIASIVVANAGFTRRMVTAMKVGDEKVCTAEFSYYYIQQAVNTYNMYYQYTGGSYVPFDTGKSLSKQQYSQEQSWEEYLSDAAVSTIQNVKTLAQAARAEGFAMTVEGSATVENTMSALKTYAENQKMSVDRYLTTVYGVGMNEELMRQIQTEYELAMEYSKALQERPQYTDEDLEDYYQNTAKSAYTYVDVRYYAFNKVEQSENTQGKTLEEAKAEADSFADGIKTEEDYSEKVLALLKEQAKENASEESSGNETEPTDNSKRTGIGQASLESVDKNLGEWAFAADRAAGDMEVIENDDGTGYYVVYMVTPAYRYDYKTADIRQLYIGAEDANDKDKMNEAKEEAEAFLKEWKEGEATEESFAAMVDEKSNQGSDGGLIEKCAKGTDERADWIFDVRRKNGDTRVIEGSGGYYVIYYIGQNTEYWKVQVEAAKRSADYNEAYAALTEQYPVEKSGFGMWLKSEPFR